jgi:hypothetical protein
MTTYNGLWLLFVYAFPFIAIGLGCLYLSATDKE